MTTPTPSPAPASETLAPLEGRLWRLASALTGDRPCATRILAAVLSHAERPGRRGGGAPQGEVRLLRAIALASRDQHVAHASPLQSEASPDVEACWDALQGLPRAQCVAWIIGNVSKDAIADSEAAFIMGVAPNVFATELDGAQSALGALVNEAVCAQLIDALSPVPADGVVEALREARASAERRWKRTGVMLVIVFLIMTGILASIMIDLLGRDARVETERERIDRAQREFSNPMPSITDSKSTP